MRRWPSVFERMRRYKFIANPTARRGIARSAISRLLLSLNRRGVDYDLELTTGPREAGRIAKASRDRFDVIVAVGGDGTVNEVLQGMIFSPTPFGVIPCGSGNDFVKSIGVPTDIEAAVDILLRGDSRSIDAGTINGHYFGNGVGIGFDAAVTAASRSFRRLRGLPLYLAAVVKALRTFRPVTLSISLNGMAVREDFFLLTIGNGTTCGGGFVLTPHALVDDGILDVTVVKPMGLGEVVRALPHVFRGTIEQVPKAAMHRTGSIIVESAGPVPVHVDGEIYDERTRRFELAVVPNALTVIAGASGRAAASSP